MLAVGVMCLGYLLPAAIRSRQVVVDSRIDDRFSGNLRVLNRTGTDSVTPQDQANRGYVHRPRIDSSEDPMHSPAQQRLAAADARRAAAARAARAAAASRRAAAARRRLVLTLALLAVTAVTWALVGLISAPIAVAIVPSVLFLGVLVLGRRAATLAKAADARLAEEVERARRADQARAARIAASTHAREQDAVPQGQSSLRIEVDPAQLIAEEQASEEVSAPATRTDQSWTPVPVPAPVYTMKPAAPRREVEPVRAESDSNAEAVGDGSAGSAASAASPEPAAHEAADGVDSRNRARARADIGDVDLSHGAGGNAGAAPSVNLQEVLERRRAVGQ